MTADVPDDDGNLTVPLRDNHEADVELLTGGYGPAYARFHAPDWHGTPGIRCPIGLKIDATVVTTAAH
ncbi:hypothetical protein [Kibdelosporangium aridum]|uniref:Uncharacterized protein n=1 Tax=Kibdelosporangium aridum TaxID=2030 RepID=A0A1W2FU75_KIBAR|nr:hypothetical protein [Kibdelosporangium aridum]SMD25433.1 hypothetical protein SAMN05661093_09119 [Kibdelosporangium aridum]